MTVYLAYIWDSFSGERVLVGVFDSPGKAEDAIDIALKQCKLENPTNTPDGRFAYGWVDLVMNTFDIEELSGLLY